MDSHTLLTHLTISSVMNKQNPKVDKYFIEGCGRCSLWRTPKCKALRWNEEMNYLRMLILDSELSEEIKWSVPCYTYNNSNILIMSAFKEYCAISFFKGVLLKDEKGLLRQPGENSNSVRMFRFSNLSEIIKIETDIKEYIKEAIDIEKSGLKIPKQKASDLIIPDELQEKFNEFSDLKKAFFALTPGRQRAYIIYFTQPKQSKTKVARIEKNIQQILLGKGLNDR